MIKYLKAIISMRERRKNPAQYWRKKGMKIGENCEIYSSASFGSEPYLISIGNHVRVNAGSRTQNRDGWGLGLYIVKTIVCSHGENISVSSKDGRTEFTFTMPLVN